MRDKIRPMQYWNERIEKSETLRPLRIERLNNGLIASERINIVKQDMVNDYLYTIKSKYSAGYLVDDLKEDLLKAIDLTYESWDGFCLVASGRPLGSLILKQYYLSDYDSMIWMLSLAYFLGVDTTDFKKLVAVIDRDGVKDKLFEFIIRAKLPERPIIESESYQGNFYIPQSYEKLREAITEPDKLKAQELVKLFITEFWYKLHKVEGWYNYHKSEHDAYSGYWSFETAAIVKIMGLDDSSFIDCQYYPKDLVHQDKE